LQLPAIFNLSRNSSKKNLLDKIPASSELSLDPPGYQQQPDLIRPFTDSPPSAEVLLLKISSTNRRVAENPDDVIAYLRYAQAVKILNLLPSHDPTSNNSTHIDEPTITNDTHFEKPTIAENVNASEPMSTDNTHFDEQKTVSREKYKDLLSETIPDKNEIETIVDP
jgi:hypothetical protein